MSEDKAKRTRIRPREITDEEDAAIIAAAESDPDNPPLTDEQLAEMRPFAEVHPDLIRSLRRQRARRRTDRLER